MLSSMVSLLRLRKQSANERTNNSEQDNLDSNKLRKQITMQVEMQLSSGVTLSSLSSGHPE